MAFFFGWRLTARLYEAWWCSSERRVLSYARRLVGSDGSQITAGPITIWSDGANESASLVQRAYETMQHRAQELFGRSIEPTGELLVLCFSKIQDCIAYAARQSVFAFEIHSSIATAMPRAEVFCEDLLLRGLYSPESFIREIASYPVIASTIGWRMHVPWLHIGVMCWLVHGDKPSEMSARTRRLQAHMRREQELSPTEVFRMTRSELVRHLMNAYDPFSFRLQHQHEDQSASIFDYLWRLDSESDHSRIRSFLNDATSFGAAESAMEKHFCFSLESLFNQWHRSMRKIKLGPIGATPPWAVEALDTELLPAIRDRGAILPRIFAIRQMGSGGFLHGADTLIGMLESADNELGNELTSALESISGESYGDDVSAWRRWWDEQIAAY